MPNPASWPIPAALSVDQTLQDLTEHAGLDISEDDFDVVSCHFPHLVAAWVSAAARYAATDFQLQLLYRPIEWMRDEISPRTGWDIDEIDQAVQNLSGLFKERQRLTALQTDAHRAFTRACQPLITEGLLYPSAREWRDITLVAHPLTEPTLVQHAPRNTDAPWPLVKARHSLLEQLAKTQHKPEPGKPVVARALAGLFRLDHDGTWRRLLPDPDGWYWLRDFAWSEPAASADKTHTTTPDQTTTA